MVLYILVYQLGSAFGVLWPIQIRVNYIDKDDTKTYHLAMNIKTLVNDLLDSGWNQYSLAKEVGTSQPTINRASLGKTESMRSNIAFKIKDLHDNLKSDEAA